MKPFIAGYEVDIYRGMWERPKTFGAPRIWAACWLILILYSSLIVLIAGHPAWITWIGITWMGGQATLVALTKWDAAWDQLFTQWLMTGKTRYYRAG